MSASSIKTHTKKRIASPYYVATFTNGLARTWLDCVDKLACVEAAAHFQALTILFGRRVRVLSDSEHVVAVLGAHKDFVIKHVNGGNPLALVVLANGLRGKQRRKRDYSNDNASLCRPHKTLAKRRQQQLTLHQYSSQYHPRILPHSRVCSSNLYS
jgi:hypothetical protein